MNQKGKLVAAIVLLVVAAGVILYSLGVFDPKPTPIEAPKDETGVIKRPGGMLPQGK